MVPALHFIMPLLKIVPSPWNAFGVIFMIAGTVINMQADGLFRRCGSKLRLAL